MNPSVESGTKCQNLDLEGLHSGRCDISSVSIQTDGQCVYGFLTFHGRLVQNTHMSYDDIDTLPQLELPGSDTASLAIAGFEGGSMFGNSALVGTYNNGYGSTILENNTPMEVLALPDRQEGIGPVFGVIMSANLEPPFDVTSQLAETPPQTTAKQHFDDYQTFHKPFSGKLDQSNPEEVNGTGLIGQRSGFNNEFVSYTINGQETNSSFHNSAFLHGAGMSQDNSLADMESRLSTNELTFPNGAAQSSYQESSFSSVSSMASSESNFSDTGRLSSQATSVSSAASTSFNDFSAPERARTPDQESFFSSVPQSSSEPEVTTAGTVTLSAPARRSCPLCRSTFKRVGDLKRHSGKHLPRNFHCKQPGCGRKGVDGFYRRDKLRAHERQMHGME